MTQPTTFVDPDYCPYCSKGNYHVYHYGSACPKVKAIEYYPNGTIKRVEFLPAPPAPVPDVTTWWDWRTKVLSNAGYCSDCDRAVQVWWRISGTLGCCQECHGYNVRLTGLLLTEEEETMNEKSCCSDCEELVGPLGPLVFIDTSMVMEKLEVAWHDLREHCQYSLCQTLALILPEVFGDVAFGDEEFNVALDEVLATWDNTE